MKKINYFLLLVAALWSTTAVADVVFDETNFPDEGLREAIYYAYWEDYGIRLNDGDILTDEMLALDLWLDGDDCGIESLQGIEYLTGLTHIQLWRCNIEDFDFSNNPMLEFIDVMYNPIKSINLSGCTQLKTLSICPPEGQSGDLEELDISMCVNLTQLTIRNEPLGQLDLSQCILFARLDFEGMEVLETLDLRQCKNLTQLNCKNCNQLSVVKFYTPDINDPTDIALSRGIHFAWFENMNDLFSITLENQLFLNTLYIKNCHNISALNLENDISLETFEYTGMSGRLIQVYSTEIDSDKQYYIPLATTAAHKGIKDLIEQENNFEDEDTGFDWANVVTESITGATLGELNGEAVLWLDKTTTGGTEGLHRMTYEYLTHCPNEDYATVQFYLDWAEATTLRGDVNGDSEVDINDVTLLIDVILGKSVEYNATAADCNTASGDGTIDINDVTALINYVLAGNW